jgi:hypothetical protein
MNYLRAPPEWPDLPRTLYVGHEKNKRLRVHPLPPDTQSRDWAQPYSIRSFIYQAGRSLGCCEYRCTTRGTVMDQKVFSDLCYPVSEEWADEEPISECHMACGWIHGETTCPLWERVGPLCQTEPEKRFLHRYLSYVKDRQFPMLIPQAWIGIADRRRVDFVAFVPLQHWNYKWVAIQLDASHSSEQEDGDRQRDAFVEQNNYHVISLRPTNSGYMEEVRSVVERFDAWMRAGEEDPWSVAVDLAVYKCEEEVDDFPF